MGKSRAVAAATIALISALSLTGCGDKVISGSPKTVVQAAQELSVDAKEKAAVTGESKKLMVSEDETEYQEGDEMADITDGDYMVYLVFSEDGMTTEQANRINSGRFTVTGTLSGQLVGDTYAYISVDSIE